MTVSVPAAAQANHSKDSTAIRKRRRRAPAGGAADDCFTCTKRSVKCDRRRPYCSQCLEVGNDCSGYKTQLTWGVGVASRGKLRGLSLPIAKAPPVNPVKRTSPPRPRANSTIAAGAMSQWTGQDELARRNEMDTHNDQATPGSRGPSGPSGPFHGFNVSQLSSAEGMPPVSQASWPGMTFSTNLPADGPRFGQRPGTHLPQVHIPEQSLSSSADSLSDVDYMSPLSHSFPREDIPFMHSPTIMYESFNGHDSSVPQSPASAILIEHPRAPTSCPSLVYAPSEPSSSLHSHVDSVLEAQLSRKFLRECEPLGNPDMDTYSTSAQSAAHFWGPTAEEEATSHNMEQNPSSWPSSFDTPAQALPVSADLLAKVPFLMDYYEHTMCPSMVFIDGPNNPFRDHILQLATNSRSLRHAICALSACNLRMKGKLSLGHDGRELSDKRYPNDSGAGVQPEDQSLSEEYQHRNLAVHLLNEQLNDPAKARHDSVLATILLLCHYRMAESGIAKFHTQFAGVKKILGMRRSAQFNLSRDSAWMEALFTYFDAISASINDREAQLNTSFYGVVPDAQLLPPGAENIVGCDRELFKTIIKLGRLNLLSQHRPVQTASSNSLPRHVPSRSQSPLASPLGHTYKASYSSLGDYFGHANGLPNHRFDGNGFGTTLDDDEILSSHMCSSATYDDHRSTFWREWKEARVALQSWQFDTQRLLASLSVNPTSAQVRDLRSLSEAFRYAALLYTERLASPSVPSSHNNFRNLVSQVVYYATSLEAGSLAEKFLLWPLFVAGSECVNELQQNIVRSKCRGIMARSGYMNNLAALDVLERLWSGECKEPSSPVFKLPGKRRGPFNWTKCIGGPGVEVEWIMF